MTLQDERTIRDCIDAMTAANPAVQFATVLVGSVARGRSTNSSDIDIVFVSEQGMQCPRCSGRVHAQLFTTDAFLQQLRTGQDFPSWCVRLGLTIADPGVWVKDYRRTRSRTMAGLETQARALHTAAVSRFPPTEGW